MIGNGGYENVVGLIVGGFSLFLLALFLFAFTLDFGPGFRTAITFNLSFKSQIRGKKRQEFSKPPGMQARGLSSRVFVVF